MNHDTVVDLSRVPSSNSQEQDDLFDEFYDYSLYMMYTIEATLHKPGEWITSKAFCENLVQGTICAGEVNLIRYDVPQEIRWQCQKCGDHGKIVNFENTFWDCRNLSEEEIQQRTKMLSEIDEDEDIDPLAILDNMSNDEKLELLDILDRYMKGMGSDMSRELGGLDSQKVYRLLSEDWTKPGSAIHLKDDLPFEAVEGSLFLHNARAFLTLLQEEGSFGATKELGNLNRKSVAKLIEVCRWPDDYLEYVRRLNKVIDEDDIWLLMIIRVLLDLAGLIHKRKDAFLLTKKNSNLLNKSQAGKLYRILFHTLFKKMNLAYLWGGPEELPSLQDSIPYILYRLHQVAQDWISSEKMVRDVLLETTYEELEWASEYSKTSDYLYYYVLRPLVYFGIIEERFSSEHSNTYSSTPDEFRITPLFEQFITFNIGESNADNIIPISGSVSSSSEGKSAKAETVDPDQTIYQLKITLKKIKPEIWRRILVPADTLLPDLHKMIQTAMGWSNSHLHQFEKNRHYYNEPDYDDWDDANETNYGNIRIGDLLKKVKESINYEYDFGDGWEHKIILEKKLKPDPKTHYPVCTGGARNCPPEDCGGPFGYIHMLEALNDPQHNDHDMFEEWTMGMEIDPEYFDKDEVNALFRSPNYGCIEL